ncbi:hypothetical protein SynBIOSU31_02075 [Synechococcus sp. BIOS-U3-1]|uniref:hypothetical protein n=1 Tax=Synechococcus sp. BIOS-U3-1 TaxID=1400865 RepID=UPI001645D65C|nr:hypothetical protein [Synechococcus sp. BIOS-U3-1]QNI58941.1 hypothetical protein SynBIOSU31_02075 [Synechococcus sp. BIOS-U3-1]
MNNTHTDTNPVDLLILGLLLLVEATCWIINELAGFHAEEVNDSTIDTPNVHATTTSNQDYIDYVLTLTVKQLR